MSGILAVLVFCFAIVIAILAIIFLVVPLMKGIVWMIGGLFGAVGWIVRHVFEFIGGMLTDIVRFLGAIIAGIVLVPLVLVNVVIGRWSASGHFARSIKRECGVGSTCLYRVVLQRPLRFLLLGGLLEGLEERVNEAVEAAPAADKPSRRAGVFEGYTIVGSLPGGGSGAKLYVAEPHEQHRARLKNLPDQVVIKSFTLTDGSSLPQIVRESRALEAAKQLGLVLEHGMDEHRFFYVMPYHHGDHLGIVTRQLHGRSDGRGLSRAQLDTVFVYVEDLLQTLCRYHRGGLWHKDVKPDNVIIHDGRAHLVDLGLVTPLRSAMTLTTHGTEYFRDPEMVRMALRGVKVHQVDGAKFDIYAAGAVLYFVVENTFPAHGGLSAFSKNSPEAVRWIVRRAMADYNKRYEAANGMLADLAFLKAAPDPFAVKPAELPSMRGRDDAEFETEVAVSAPVPEPEVVAAAGSPMPPGEPASDPDVKVAAWGISAGRGGIKVTNLNPDPAAPAPVRPPIRVTNWWTGAYEVDDAATTDPEFQGGAREFRHQVRQLRRRTHAQGQAVRNSVMSARRAARDQIREARTRAREIRRRAREHRHRAVEQRQPSAAMAGMSLAVMATLILIVGAVVATRDNNDAGRYEYHVEHLSPPSPVLAAPHADLISETWPMILINDHPAAANARVQAEIERILREHRDQGWTVVEDDQDAEVAVRKCLPPGLMDPDEPLPPLLEKTLLDHDLGGILRIKAGPGDGAPQDRIVVVPLRVTKSSG